VGPVVKLEIPTLVTADLVRSLLGERLGQGISREVFEWGIDTDFVIKLEVGNGHFQNVTEWSTWAALNDTKHGKHLAPCKWISQCGTALLMRRTSPLLSDREPKKLPGWLTDTKRGNYGMLNGTVVCHDYGTTLLTDIGARSSRDRKVNWWG
jgi:hypothetical protein